MNVFAKFDEILSRILQDIKKNVTDTKTFRTQKILYTVGQRENSIHSHKHSLRGYKNYNGQESPMLRTKFRGNRQESPMLRTKFRGNRHTRSGEEII